MSYVDRNLMTGETVVYRTRLHWILFLGPLVATILFLVAGLVMWPSEGTWPAALILVAVAGVMGLLLLARFISYRASEFAVTNKRVIIKLGVFRQRSIEILLSKIEAIGIDQPFIGRVLGFGDITVGGTGGTKEIFDRIHSPLDFRRHVQEQTSR